MEWIKKYNDLSTKAKKRARTKIFNDCGVSKSSFYLYYRGKQPRKIILKRVEAIINDLRTLKA